MESGLRILKGYEETYFETTRRGKKFLLVGKFNKLGTGISIGVAGYNEDDTPFFIGAISKFNIMRSLNKASTEICKILNLMDVYVQPKEIAQFVQYLVKKESN